MSGWSCQFEVKGICLKVDVAICRPGMKGCILQGKVTFHDGETPSPERPAGPPPPQPLHHRAAQAPSCWSAHDGTR